MATQVKHRRGNSSELSTFTPAISELIMNTDTNELILGDGVTVGGHEISSKKQVNSVAVMKSKPFKAGDFITTKGYYASGDGGGADYLIVAGGTGTDDGGAFHNLSNGLQAKLLISDKINIKWYGATGGGATDDTVFLQNAFAFANGVNILFSPGRYRVTDTISIDGLNFSDVNFDSDARILCGANNITVFKSVTNAWGVKFFDPDIRGNGFTGCTAFDVVRLEQLGAGIFRPVIRNMGTGIFLRSLCTGVHIDDPDIQDTILPIAVLDGSGGIKINHPRIDSFGAIGIHVQPATPGVGFPNVGVEIAGGYIQNGGEGIRDEDGIATQILGVYFETCTVADIKLDTARFTNIRGTNHTSTGNVAIFSRNSDGVRIYNPFMSSGGRTVGLFDFDASNTNCFADYSTGAASENTPVGSVLGLGRSNETSANFTPIVKGSISGGTATYSLQVGSYSRIGNQLNVVMRLNWSGHTGTGSMVLDGLPAAAVATTIPVGRANVLHTGFSITGIAIATGFTGTGKEMAVYDYSAAGGLTLVPMQAAGAIDVCATFSLI